MSILSFTYSELPVLPLGNCPNPSNRKACNQISLGLLYLASPLKQTHRPVNTSVIFQHFADVGSFQAIQVDFPPQLLTVNMFSQRQNCPPHCPPASDDSFNGAEVQQKPLKVCFTSNFATKRPETRAKA